MQTAWCMLMAATGAVSSGGVVDVDVGLVTAGSPRVVEVALAHKGPGPWVADRVVVSCPSCVKVLSHPKRLVPGGQGRVSIRLTARPEPGPQAWGAALIDADGQPTRIRMRGVVAGLAASPRAVVFDAGSPRHMQVRLTWHGPNPPRELSANASAAWLDARAPTADGPATWQSDLAVDADQLGSGGGGVWEASVDLRVDVAAPPVARIPVRCELPSAPVVPGGPVFLGCARPGAMVQRVVRVPIPHVEVSRTTMPGLQAEARSTDGQTTEVRLRWTCPPSTHGRLDGTLTLRDPVTGEAMPARSVFGFALSDRES